MHKALITQLGRVNKLRSILGEVEKNQELERAAERRKESDIYRVESTTMGGMEIDGDRGDYDEMIRDLRDGKVVYK
eukprot:gnl/Chilomastix_caulleri/6780.p1 GENE.gnl/Chilomastix_caulleri/6780~~gnl/Chilomastix_caulleri/6780.p1  ORF type:complete len:76 (+),score=9.30 gnl/Chilomastix_caulleri/6780:3-230(+)